MTDGLARIYSLSLAGAPAADVLEATTAVWVEDLWARLAPSQPTPEDLPRIAAAFQTLRLSCRWWPAPVQFLEHLPPRTERRLVALPPGSLSDAERADRMLRMIRAREEAGLPPLRVVADPECPHEAGGQPA